ncbi:MAG: molecular chaperone HtpG [Gammaproteobacteria bacterium]|jgi:molecular chaperone HtpG
MTDSSKIQPQKETLGFETEVKQLLHLMINALYSNKEIFLRELVSNASDAIDKLRFESLEDQGLCEGDANFEVYVDFDEKKKTITVRDNGIGMSREEVIENLGTIAKSGTREFFAALTGDQAKDAKLIGQFGVGFYSSFIVADKVTVITRCAGLTKEHGVRWESAGQGDYTIENIECAQRGTKVVLHLKDLETTFLDSSRLREIITKYSNHINVPILMKKPPESEPETKDDEEKKAEPKKAEIEWEKVNHATALWIRSKSEITKEEYREFYKHVSHDFEDPMLWSHNKVEGKLEYTSLLYIPAHAPFDLWNYEHRYGLKLYIKRVFIMDDAKQFLPQYLRFVRGVIDSNDLPLNISREILQDNPLIPKIRGALIKRILNILDDLSKKDKDKYAKFWQQFGKVLKEGPAEDYANREQIAKLLRFASTHADHDTQDVSLEDYVGRMKKEQDKIYYVTADSFMAAKNSPHLEIFRKQGIEVLLLSDKIDEWLVTHLTEFDGRHMQAVTKGALDLGELEDEEHKKEQEKVKDDYAGMLEQIKKILGEKIKEVRITSRLTTSPACIVADEYDLNMNMKRILQSIGQDIPESKPIFEINPEHAIVKRIKNETDDERFKEWIEILFEQSVLAEGGQLKDPATFVSRLNKLLLELA